MTKTCTTDIYLQNECAHAGLSGLGWARAEWTHFQCAAVERVMENAVRVEIGIPARVDRLIRREVCACARRDTGADILLIIIGRARASNM